MLTSITTHPSEQDEEKIKEDNLRAEGYARGWNALLAEVQGMLYGLSDETWDLESMLNVIEDMRPI